MKITFINGEEAGKTFEFVLPRITVGREDANDLRLPTAGVSRFHATFKQELQQGGWSVEDQGSTNGVKVNGERISGKFFLAENVKGLLSFCKGKVFQMILSDFSQLGYKVQYKLFNAANYGVPQKRERVIIVGVRNDIEFTYEFPAETHSAKPTLFQKSWVSVGEALKNIPDPDLPHTLKNHEYSKYKLRFNGYIGHRRIDPNQPAPTVTARGDDKGGVVVLHHPNNLRRMSCRELATVQSFPLDFEFYGTRSSVYRQIGNAVPPLLAKAIAEKFNMDGEQ